jgi:hypothetical protein
MLWPGWGVSIIAAVMMACACDSEPEALNVLRAFEVSACLSKGKPALDAVTCTEWRRPAPEVLQIDFRNVKFGCEIDTIPWQVVATSSAPAELTLRATWPSDLQSACGPCLYDFSFKVQIDPEVETIDTTFELVSCSSCDAEVIQLISLQPAATDSGATTCTS